MKYSNEYDSEIIKENQKEILAKLEELGFKTTHPDTLSNSAHILATTLSLYGVFLENGEDIHNIHRMIISSYLFLLADFCLKKNTEEYEKKKYAFCYWIDDIYYRWNDEKHKENTNMILKSSDTYDPILIRYNYIILDNKLKEFGFTPLKSRQSSYTDTLRSLANTIASYYMYIEHDDSVASIHTIHALLDYLMTFILEPSTIRYQKKYEAFMEWFKSQEDNNFQ